MAPTYLPGEQLTALRRWRPVRVGDVVVVRDPRETSRWLLKRCVAKSGSSSTCGATTREASTDSREFGLVPTRSVGYLVLHPSTKGSRP